MNGRPHFAWPLAVLLLGVPLGAAGMADLEAAHTREPSPQVSVAAANDPLQTAYYIVRFAQYVRWPAEGASPWLVCVPSAAGTSAGDYASQVTRGKAFEVRKIADPAQLSGCHILDLTQLDAQTARAFVEQAQNHPILTVGSGNAFCSEGGIICMRRGKDHLSFEINLSATRQAGLLISAKLLSLGKGATVAGENP